MAAFAAALWLTGAAATGQRIPGAGLGAQLCLLDVPVPLYIMAVATALQLLRSWAAAACEEFHPPMHAGSSRHILPRG